MNFFSLIFKGALSFIPGVGPFISMVGSFILEHWKFFAVAGLIGIVIYQNEASTRFLLGLQTIPHLEVQITKDQADIKNLTGDLNEAVTANKALTGTITELNGTVGQWKATSDDLQKKNDALQTQLVQMQKDNDKKVQDILNSQTPVTCEASIDFLRSEVGSLNWNK